MERALEIADEDYVGAGYLVEQTNFAGDVLSDQLKATVGDDLSRFNAFRQGMKIDEEEAEELFDFSAEQQTYVTEAGNVEEAVERALEIAGEDYRGAGYLLKQTDFVDNSLFKQLDPRVRYRRALERLPEVLEEIDEDTNVYTKAQIEKARTLDELGLVESENLPWKGFWSTVVGGSAGGLGLGLAKATSMWLKGAGSDEDTELHTDTAGFDELRAGMQLTEEEGIDQFDFGSKRISEVARAIDAKDAFKKAKEIAGGDLKGAGWLLAQTKFGEDPLFTPLETRRRGLLIKAAKMASDEEGAFEDDPDMRWALAVHEGFVDPVAGFSDLFTRSVSGDVSEVMEEIEEEAETDDDKRRVREMHERIKQHRRAPDMVEAMTAFGEFVEIGKELDPKVQEALTKKLGEEVHATIAEYELAGEGSFFAAAAEQGSAKKLYAGELTDKQRKDITKTHGEEFAAAAEVHAEMLAVRDLITDEGMGTGDAALNTILAGTAVTNRNLETLATKLTRLVEALEK